MKNIELAQNKRTVNRKSTLSNNIKNLIVPFLLIVIVVLGTYSISSLFINTSHRERLDAIDNYIINIDKRLAQLEGNINKLSALEDQRTKFEISLLNRVEGLESMRVTNIMQMSEDDINPHQEAKQEEEIKKKPPEKEATIAATAKYHTVSPGETLYRISLNYGLTVDELRKINNIGPDAVIYIGQKLLVTEK